MVSQGLSAAVVTMISLVMSHIMVDLYHFTPDIIGIVKTAENSAFLFFGLLAGHVADKYNKRNIMIASDLMRILGLLCMILLLAAGIRHFSIFVALSFLLGVAVVFL